jgi:hypothetical protein
MSKIIRSSWFLWVLVTSVGSAIGVTFAGRFEGLFDDYSLQLFFLVEIALGGLLISFGQWMILRTKRTGTWGWIPATAIGLPVGFFVGFWINEFLPGSLIANKWIQTYVMASVAGIFAGTLQWIALQRKLKNSLKWILVSTLSWGIGITITGFIFETYLSNIDLGYLFAPILGMFIGIIVGIISGAFAESALIRMEHKNSIP